MNLLRAFAESKNPERREDNARLQMHELDAQFISAVPGELVVRLRGRSPAGDFLLDRLAVVLAEQSSPEGTE